MRFGSIARLLSLFTCVGLLAACAATDGTMSGSGKSAASSAASAPAPSGGGSELPTKGTAVNAAAAAERSVAASGTQGDSLQACLDRIPKDATAGQRSVAESTCQRDHAGQRPIAVVPGK